MTNPSTTCILVVDDEPALLRLMQAFLERTGYSVTPCGDATSALDTFRANPDKHQIVIADLSLPDMKGDKMALEMTSANPALRVLLCSGYAYDVESLPPEVRPRCAALLKPFLPNDLT